LTFDKKIPSKNYSLNETIGFVKKLKDSEKLVGRKKWEDSKACEKVKVYDDSSGKGGTVMVDKRKGNEVLHRVLYEDGGERYVRGDVLVKMISEFINFAFVLTAESGMKCDIHFVIIFFVIVCVRNVRSEKCCFH
jgi:hypothetical protein